MGYAQIVKPGHRFKLEDQDPGEHGGLNKEEAVVKLGEISRRFAELQALQTAARQQAVLVVLQGRDAGGKDGACKRIVVSTGGRDVRVASFKAPSPTELAHDFLWRVHPHTPAKGELVVFNRSHYEDVLVPKAHGWVSDKEIERRYDHIDAFERLLTDSGTIVVKFFLNISRKEQAERLIAREEDPTKSWKLDVHDWEERELWNEYEQAFEGALNRCTTESAPWYCVPADHKWFRDLAILETLTQALAPYEKEWLDHLERLGKEAVPKIEEYRKRHPEKA